MSSSIYTAVEGEVAVAVHEVPREHTGRELPPLPPIPLRGHAAAHQGKPSFVCVVTPLMNARTYGKCGHVQVYHLVEQKLVKKLLSGCKWISSIDIHPSGDHIIVGRSAPALFTHSHIHTYIYSISISIYIQIDCFTES
jgi:hypothetical protein